MDPSLPLARRQLPLLPVAAKATAGPADAPTPKVATLIDLFLQEQADTTAAQRFSQHHDGADGNVRERWYRDLLPATPPGPGQQYAFDVDLDACSGCKACVTACNSLNALEPDESWRTVGTLVGVGDRGIVQPVTTACHHCVDPGCLNGCPANAYEKDPVTGIVSHLDDSCIGCRYCTLTCPYEVPEFRSDLGIVRKCDMCHDRLAVGEAPACVQACPTQAIQIRVVDVERMGSTPFPFTAPAPETTRPTTTFRTTRDLTTDVEPVDLPTVRLSHAHLPLTAMLVLTQAAVGAFVGLTLLSDALAPAVRRSGDRASLILAVVAIVASVAHLGRPLLAWRAVLGLGHSWLSREIVAFGGFAGLGILAALARATPLPLPPEPVAALASIVGLAAVLSSGLVYVVTGRRHWRWTRTLPRFAATVLAGGGAVALVVVLASGVRPSQATVDAFMLAALLGVVGGLAIDSCDVALHRHRGAGDARGRTATLLTTRLRGAFQTRLVLGGISVAGLLVARTTVSPSSTASTTVALVFAGAALVAVLAAEALERWWFFTAESDLRMPGRRA